MENSQIWLKPKPTHIDEYFEGFLNYLRTATTTTDALYQESLRLLRERVSLLVQERTSLPIYRQSKEPEVLKFNVRLCGAWLLAFMDAEQMTRKQVLLTMINNLILLAIQSNIKVLNTNTFAYKNVPTLINLALKLAMCNMPTALSFTWNDLVTFSLDMFVVNFVKMEFATVSDCYYEGKGLMVAKNSKLLVANYSKQQYDKKYMQRGNAETSLLPEYGLAVCNDQDLLIKESQKDDILVIEKFVGDTIALMKSFKKEASAKRLLRYSDKDEVAVEVTSVTPTKIMLKTIDPNYYEIRGQLIFDKTIKMFAKVYTVDMWAKVLKVGDRFMANVYTTNNTFSVTDSFIKYIEYYAPLDELFDAHNNNVGWLQLREFWTNDGFMVYVNLTEEENEELEANGGNACIEIIDYGEDQYKGCVYGKIYDYQVEKRDITREEFYPGFLRRFIDELSDIKVSEREKEDEPIPMSFIKEYCSTLNILQSREVNPMLRYRILSAMRIFSTLIEDEKDDTYCQYIAKYIKTLILFAQADSNEGRQVTPFDAPEDLKDVEAVRSGADILRILSCFAKDYDATSDVLDPYIEAENEILSKIASLVQSYNRLVGLLEGKTLRGIKKQILNHLSVVTDGDSTLELASELEGIFGDEDDMKEFKTSFFVAPKDAKEQRQYHNIFRGICAMMNNRGGVLYLGVNDKGVPVGLKNDLEFLAKTHKVSPTLDAYMLYISKQGEDWFKETYWKYVTLKPISEHNVVSIIVEPYPYDIVYLKDGTTYLRKNNASAPITDESTIEDIRRRRMENLRKTDDKIIILQDAIQRERKVRLIGYKSNNSGTIKNRTLEAFYIDNNEYIHCYDADSDKVKMFRISRAERIVMLDDPWECKSKHTAMNVDPFHMSGTTKITVRLKLKLQAKNGLEEYYPEITQYIKQLNSDTWMLDTFVYNLYPLMLFYLSHAQYVEIIEAAGLREAVRDYVKSYLQV